MTSIKSFIYYDINRQMLKFLIFGLILFLGFMIVIPDAFAQLISVDFDGDGVKNANDICPLEFDMQLDLDSDGLGDACDFDVNNDGIYEKPFFTTLQSTNPNDAFVTLASNPTGNEFVFGLNVFAFMDVDSGFSIGDSHGRFSSLETTPASNIRTTYSDLELIFQDFTGGDASTRTFTEVYADNDANSIASIHLSDSTVLATATDLVFYVITDLDSSSPDYLQATGFGTAKLTGPLGSAFYNEVIADSPSGQLNFIISQYDAVDSEGTFEADVVFYIPTNTCQSGYELTNNICVPITCPVGEELVNGICVPITCPVGEELVNGICVPITCPVGEELVNGICVPITCPVGEELVDGVCVDTVCGFQERMVNDQCIHFACEMNEYPAGGQCLAVEFESYESGDILVLGGLGYPNTYLFSVNPDTGDRKVITNFDNPVQGVTITPHTLASSSDGTAWVSTMDSELYRVDPNNGQRTFVGTIMNHPNPSQYIVNDMAWFENDGVISAIGSLGGSVGLIDTTTGITEVKSSFINPDNNGNFGNPTRITVSQANSIFVLVHQAGISSNPWFADVLVSVDETGQREVITDFADADFGPVIPGMFPSEISYGDSHNILVAMENTIRGFDSLRALVSVDINTGQREIINDFRDESLGYLVRSPSDVKQYDSERIFVMEALSATGGSNLIQIDVDTQQRTILSDFHDAAQGPTGRSDKLDFYQDFPIISSGSSGNSNVCVLIENSYYNTIVISGKLYFYQSVGCVQFIPQTLPNPILPKQIEIPEEKIFCPNDETVIGKCSAVDLCGVGIQCPEIRHIYPLIDSSAIFIVDSWLDGSITTEQYVQKMNTFVNGCDFLPSNCDVDDTPIELFVSLAVLIFLIGFAIYRAFRT